MKRLIIQAIAISPPGTMGGNTKICLEMIRHLADRYELHVIVPAPKRETLSRNLLGCPPFSLHVIPGYRKSELAHPVASFLHYHRAVKHIFAELDVGRDDLVYTATDGHVDVAHTTLLQRRIRFTWIGCFFIFVPGMIENIRKGYGFPVLRYALGWCYQRICFACLKAGAAAFVITNVCDARHFPARFKDKLFAMYGGVNVEQIPERADAKTRDVVFCSRLNPQKGVSGLLDIWARVRRQCPNARLAVIGNGDAAYEAMLRDKADRLGIASSIDWLGYVNNEAKYAIYASAKVFVHPTVYDNNGMVAAEALCSGLPVVMFDLENLRAVYTTGCAKVPEGDQTAFAAEVARLLQNDEHRTAVAPDPGQLAALRAHWNWKSRVAEFESFLEKVGHMQSGIHKPGDPA